MYRLTDYSLDKYKLKSVNRALELLGSGAGAVICELSGRTYQKTNAGWALAGYFYYKAGYTGPLLVSDVAANVTYTAVGVGDHTSSTTIVYNGKTYYVGSTGAFMSGNITDTSGTGRVKMTRNDYPGVAIELLDRYFRNGY